MNIQNNNLSSIRKFILLFISMGVVVLIILGYQNRFKNPLDQIIKAAHDELLYTQLNNLPKPSEVYHLVGSQKLDDRLLKYEISASDFETTRLYITDTNEMLLEYRRKLTKDRYLFISYTYKKNIVHENVELSSSDMSKSVVKIVEDILAEDSTVGETDTYNWSSNKEKPSFDLFESPSILSEIEKYGITKRDLVRKAHDILHDELLERWTENTEKKFPNKNLGNLQIKKSVILK